MCYFNWNIWVILGIVVVINAFGSPLKILRSALLQAKEAPYIESALSYGASNRRIITHYLLPRIMPVLIPQLVTQVPSFIFWEATLGFFNIQSIYPHLGANHIRRTCPRSTIWIAVLGVGTNFPVAANKSRVCHAWVCS